MEPHSYGKRHLYAASATRVGAIACLMFTTLAGATPNFLAVPRMGAGGKIGHDPAPDAHRNGRSSDVAAPQSSILQSQPNCLRPLPGTVALSMITLSDGALVAEFDGLPASASRAL